MSILDKAQELFGKYEFWYPKLKLIFGSAYLIMISIITEIDKIPWTYRIVIITLALTACVWLIDGVITLWHRYGKGYGIKIMSGEEIEKKDIKFSKPEQITGHALNGHTIDMNDLTRKTNVIDGRTFENCHIYGPAMITFTNQIVSGAMFEVPNNDLDALLIDVGKGAGKRIPGVIGFHNCIIKNCTFHNIGIIATADVLESIRKAFQ